MDSFIGENDKILVYNTSLCRICQISSHLDVIDTSSIIKETEEGTYMDIMKFIFSDIFWVEDNLTSVACTVCLKKVVEIADFKRLCWNTNVLRGAIHISIEIDPVDPLKIEAQTPCLDSNNSSTPAEKNDDQTTWTTAEVQMEDLEIVVATLESINIVNDCDIIQNQPEQSVTEVSNDSDNETIVQLQVVDIDFLPVINKVEETEDQKALDQPIIQSKEKPKRRRNLKAKSETSEKDELPTKRRRQRKKPNDILKEVETQEKKSKCLCCDICGEQFHFMNHLERHIYRHNGTRNYVCTICGRTYITHGDLCEHLKLHRTDYNYACDICQKRFKSSSNLKTHKNVVHTDPKYFKYLCTECGKRFSGASGYKEHLNRHKQLRNYVCSICKKSFVSMGELQRHKITHSNNRKFNCDLCPAEYKRNYDLQIHKTEQHNIGNHRRPKSIKKYYDCNLCGKSIAYRNKFERHLKTHTSERPYQCRRCSLKFSCKSYVTTHLRRKHGIRIDPTSDFDETDYYTVLGNQPPQEPKEDVPL